MKIIEALRNHEGVRKHSSNLFFLIIEGGTKIPAAVLVSAVVARYLGPTDFGFFNYVRSIFTVLFLIVSLNLKPILVREFTYAHKTKEQLLGTSFGLTSFFSVIFTVGIIIYLIFSTEKEIAVILLILSPTLFLNGFDNIGFFFESQIQIKYVVYARLALTFFSVISRLLAVFYELSLVYFFIIVTLEILVFTVVLIFCYFYYHQKKNIKILKWRFNFKLAIDLFKNTIPVLLVSSIVLIQTTIDQIMIEKFLGYKEIGFYSASVKVIEFLVFIPMIISSAFTPTILSSKKVSSNFFWKRITDYYRLFFLIYFCIAISLFFLGEYIIITLYGKEYLPSVSLFTIMIFFRLFFIFCGLAKGSFILAENLFVFSLIAMIFSTTIHVILNYYWIPIYGIKGTIYANGISFILHIFIFDLFYGKARRNIFVMIKSIFSCYKIDVKQFIK